MTTLRVRLCIPAALLTLVAAGCGDDDDPTIDTSQAIATTATTTTTIGLAPPVDTVDIAVPGTADIPAPVGTNDIPIVPPVGSSDLPVPYLFDVTIGVDAGPERIETVPLGATVTLSITNPTSDDEFHVHGYELGDGLEVPAGQASSFTFVADQAGEFEVESHETGDVIMVLSVG